MGQIFVAFSEYLNFTFGTFNSFPAGLGKNQVYSVSMLFCLNSAHISLNHFRKAENKR